MIPETNDTAIARRLLGMADRIGNSAIPEEIANEATEARAALDDCLGDLALKADRLAEMLIAYATAASPEANVLAAHATAQAAANLRAQLQFEELFSTQERSAA